MMHSAFRPCAVVEIPRERIDAIFAYGNNVQVRDADVRSR